MKSELLTRYHRRPHDDFPAGRFALAAGLITIAVGVAATVLLWLCGAERLVADQRSALWLASLLIGLISSAAYYDRVSKHGG